MASLLTATDKSALNDVMDSLHDTFARDIQIIKEALAKCGNNQSQAAKTLQLDRSTLRRILAREEK